MELIRWLRRVAPRADTVGARMDPDERKPELLMIGPRFAPGDAPGGTNVSFEVLVKKLSERGNVGITVVSTARRMRGLRPHQALLEIVALLLILARVWYHSRRADVIMLNLTSRAVILVGPLFYTLCALRRRPILVRCFGGILDVRLALACPLIRYVATETILKSDLLLLQTKQLTRHFGKSFNAAWFPTTRQMPPRIREYPTSCRRLLFVSQLREDKGLPELLMAAKQFPEGVSLSIVGPEAPDFDARRIDSVPNAKYLGEVSPRRVPEIMESHDALVLPSRHFGEGYPGVVIEAFQMGLPVIVSDHYPLPELVSDGIDGLIADAGSASSIAQAVTRLATEDQLFEELRHGALDAGMLYRSDMAAETIEQSCREAIAKRRRTQ